MSRLPSEVKIGDFASTTQRNGEIITTVNLPDTNSGIPLSKCNIRSIFRQLERILVIVRGGLPDLTTLFDKVEFFYPVGNPLGQFPVPRNHNYTTPVFGECGEARVIVRRAHC